MSKVCCHGQLDGPFYNQLSLSMFVVFETSLHMFRWEETHINIYKLPVLGVKTCSKHTAADLLQDSAPTCLGRDWYRNPVGGDMGWISWEDLDWKPCVLTWNMGFPLIFLLKQQSSRIWVILIHTVIWQATHLPLIKYMGCLWKFQARSSWKFEPWTAWTCARWHGVWV